MTEVCGQIPQSCLPWEALMPTVKEAPGAKQGFEEAEGRRQRQSRRKIVEEPENRRNSSRSKHYSKE